MKTIVAVSLAAVLAGCAVIPGTQSSVPDVESTSPIAYASALAPVQAAACVQRNVESTIPSWFVATSTPRGAGVRLNLRSDVGTAGLVDVEPADSGSALSIRVSRHYLARTILSDKMTAGC